MSIGPFVVYSRPGCHLCEVLIEELLERTGGQAQIAVRNIETDDRWLSAYALRIPVLEYQGQLLCEGRLDRQAVDRALRQSVGSSG